MYNEVLRKKDTKTYLFKKLYTGYILHTVLWSNINAYFSLGLMGAACETNKGEKVSLT